MPIQTFHEDFLWFKIEACNVVQWWLYIIRFNVDCHKREFVPYASVSWEQQLSINCDTYELTISGTSGNTVDLSCLLYTPPTCYTIPVAIEAGEWGDYLVLNSWTDCQTSVFLWSLGWAGVSKSNEILINTTDPEVVGKQYLSIDNANIYLESIPATTPRAIAVAWLYPFPAVEVIDYGSIKGDGAGNTILWNVSFKDATAVQNELYNLTVGNLTLQDITSWGWLPVTATVTRTATYAYDVVKYNHVQIPTLGDYNLFLNWLTGTSSTTPPPYMWNALAADIQFWITNAATDLVWVTVSWDNTVWFTLNMIWVAVWFISLGITNNTTDNLWIKVTITPGTIEQQTITFDNVPTAGEWMLSYEYNGNTYYSNVLAFNADNFVLEAEVRNILAQIEAIELINLWSAMATVVGDYTTGIEIRLVGFPGASANLFQVYLW